MTDRLVLSVAEAAEALGVSDDLIYELTERGDLPCLRFGRRKVIPRRAIELLVESAVAAFNPDAVLTRLNGRREHGTRGWTDATASMSYPNDTVLPAVQQAMPPSPSGATGHLGGSLAPRAGRRRPEVRGNGEGDVAPLRLFGDGDRDAHDPGRTRIAGQSDRLTQ